MPKKRRKNVENRLFSPQTRIQTILDKSPWDSTAVFIFFCHFSVPSKQWILFKIFLQFSLPPPYTKLNLGENSGYTRPTLIVCGVRGGVGPVCIGKRPRNAKVFQDINFVHDCRYNKFSALSVTNILGIRSLGTGSYMYHYD